MNQIQYEYSYYVYYRYPTGNGIVTIVIDQKNIKSIVVDRDYEAALTPVTLLTLTIDKNIRDTISNHKDDGNFQVIIKKHRSDIDDGIETICMNETFIYFLPDNMNKTKSLDYNGEDADRKDVLTKVIIGLVKEELINLNKRQIINEIFHDTKIINLICYFSGGMNLLIEPPNNKVLDNFPVTPLTQYDEFIKYLDTHVSIYENSYYRLFMDFDRTYILSGRGKATYAYDEYRYPILINIEDTTKPTSKLQGMQITDEKYMIYIDDIDITNQKDNVTGSLYDQLIGIDNAGNISSQSIENSRSSVVSKASISRIKNLDKLNSKISAIKNKQYTVNVVKHDLDSSIFTINREYIIHHYDNNEYNGNYILNRKIEIYANDSTSVKLITFMSLNKVNS